MYPATAQMLPAVSCSPRWSAVFQQYNYWYCYRIEGSPCSHRNAHTYDLAPYTLNLYCRRMTSYSPLNFDSGFGSGPQNHSRKYSMKNLLSGPLEYRPSLAKYQN